MSLHLGAKAAPWTLCTYLKSFGFPCKRYFSDKTCLGACTCSLVSINLPDGLDGRGTPCLGSKSAGKTDPVEGTGKDPCISLIQVVHAHPPRKHK
eukprot:595264-Rhodomonas_salina.1